LVSKNRRFSDSIALVLVLNSDFEKPKRYGNFMPVIYGMPIINMDNNHLEKLKKVVKEV